jgi:hypothetical protein
MSLEIRPGQWSSMPNVAYEIDVTILHRPGREI